MVDAEARGRIGDILEEDWKVLGYVGLPEGHMRRVGLYEDEVHDLFEYTLDGRSVPIWIDQTKAQYDALRGVLEPVFRLATKILVSPASLDYFYYLIYAPRTLAHPPVWYKREQVHVFRRDDTAKDRRREKALAALNRLARMHTISFGNTGDDEGSTVTSTKYFEEFRVNIKDDTSTWSGIRSHTTLDARFVRQLLQLSTTGKETEDRMLILGTRLAVCFIHEFVHGASLASSSKILDTVKREITLRGISSAHGIHRTQENISINEDLFEDENAAEPGFSWESFVFGGVVDTVDNEEGSPLTITKWPNFRRGDQDLRRGRWKTSATIWIIPKQWLVNVNSQRWWDSVVTEDDDPLQIKRLIGYRVFRRDDNGEPDDWSASQSSEGRWPTDLQRAKGASDSRRVSKIREGMVVEDPSTSRANELID